MGEGGDIDVVIGTGTYLAIVLVGCVGGLPMPLS